MPFPLLNSPMFNEDISTLSELWEMFIKYVPAIFWVWLHVLLHSVLKCISMQAIGSVIHAMGWMFVSFTCWSTNPQCDGTGGGDFGSN